MRWCWFVLAACGSAPPPPANRAANLVRVDAKGVFEVDAPPPIEELRRRGLDSLVGSYEIAGCVLSFDYGDHSNPLVPWGLDWPTDYRYRVGTLDGKPVRWATWKTTAALHVHTGLTIFMRCPDVGLLPRAIRVLETVQLRKPVPVDERMPVPHGPAAWTSPDLACTPTRTAGTGRLTVSVIDERGRPVEGVFVLARHGEMFDGQTDARGTVALAVKPSTYQVIGETAVTRAERGVTIKYVGLTAVAGICRDVVVEPDTDTRIVLRLRSY